MADMSRSLNVELNVDAKDSVQQTQASSDSVDRLTQAIGSLVEKLGLVPNASSTAESGIKTVGTAAKDVQSNISGVGTSAGKSAETLRNMGGELGNFASDFLTHSRSISMAFDAMGLSSGQAVARMAGVGQLLTGLGDAMPSILALSAGVVAFFAAFEFGKNAVQQAAELQDSMTRLGQVVKDQGGNWSSSAQQVKAFTDAQVEMTTYSDTAVIDSLTRLVSSGMSLADAMTSTRVAEDLAAASGRSLQEATLALIEAEHGRLMGLEAMGVLTKQQVKDGVTYDQVLQQIETRMGGEAQAAASTFTGSIKQLGSEVEKLMEDLGSPFLGIIAADVTGFTGVVRVVDQDLQPSLKAISAWAVDEGPNVSAFFGDVADAAHEAANDFSNDFGPAIESIKKGVKELGDDLAPFLTGQFQAVDDALLDGKTGWDAFDLFLDRTIGSVAGLVKILGEVPQAISDMFASANQLGDWVNQQLARLGPLGKAIAYAEDPTAFSVPNETSGVMPTGTRYGGVNPTGYTDPLNGAGSVNTHTSYNPLLGGPSAKKKRASNAAPFEAGPDVVANYHDESDALKAINDELSKLPHNLDGYNQALAILAPLIAADTKNQTELTAELDNARNRLTVAADDYNTYKDSLQGVTKLSSAQKDELAQLKAAYESAQKSVDNLSTAYNKNHQELEGLQADQQRARDAIQKLTTDWQNYVDETNAKTQESLATFKMTEGQKVAYYQSVVDSINVVDDVSLNKRKQAYAAEAQAYAAMVEQEYRDELQFEQSAAQHISSFLDQIVTQHQSMAQSLRSIYQDILKWFLEMLAQMIAKALLALPILQAVFGGGGGLNFFGVSVPGFGALGAGTGAPSISGGSAIASPGASIAAGMAAAMSPSGGGGRVGSGSYGFGGGGSAGGGMSPNVSFGGGNPFGGGVVPAGGGLPSASGGASGGGFTGSGFNFGPGFASGATGAMAGFLSRTGIGPLGMAAFGGGAIGDLLFGGKGFASIGGMIGGVGMAAGGALALGGAFGPALMAMMSSPIGIGLILGASLLGAFGGSLFGNHFNPADEPDIYQQDAWGQANADLQGMTAANPMHANGKSYVMDSSTAQATGGRGWNIMFEKFVQQFRGNLSTLPATLQSAFPQIEQLWGGANDKQYFNPDGKNGYLDIGSGKRALWTDFWGMVQTYGSDISSIMQGMTPTEIYVSSVNGALRNIGTTTGGGGNPPPYGGFGADRASGGSNAIASGGAGKASGTLAQRIAQSVNMNFNINSSSTLMSEANLKRAIQDAVAQALPVSMQDLNYH